MSKEASSSALSAAALDDDSEPALTLAQVFGGADAKGPVEDPYGALSKAHSLAHLAAASARRPRDIADFEPPSFKKRGAEGAEIDAQTAALLPRLVASKLSAEEFLDALGLAHETALLRALEHALETGVAPSVGAPKPPSFAVRRDARDDTEDPEVLKKAAALEIPRNDHGVAQAFMRNILAARTAAAEAGVGAPLTPSQRAAALVWAESEHTGAAAAARALLQ